MRTMLLLPTLLAALPAAGQQLDSARTAYRDALVAVREGLLPVGAGLQSLRRDLETAAPITLQSKVTRLQRACRDAQGVLETHRPTLGEAGNRPHQVAAARALLAAMGTLDRRITEQCLRGLSDGAGTIHADSVRAWTPYRSARLREAEQGYHEAAAAFARAFDFRIPARSPRE